MTNLDALRKVLEHAKLDVRAVSTDVDREAIKIVEDMIDRGQSQCPAIAGDAASENVG